MTDDLLHEALVLFPAYQVLHAHLLTTDPRESDPHDLIGPLAATTEPPACCTRTFTANAYATAWASSSDSSRGCMKAVARATARRSG
jgi:hypothetical protein